MTEPEQSAVERPIKALAHALKSHAGDFVDEPESFDNYDAVADNLIRHLPKGWHLTRDDASHDAPTYETWVQKVADALHETCLNEWRAIAAVNPERAITQHMSDAHYGQAHDLVRRLNLATRDDASHDAPEPSLLDLTAGDYSHPADDLRAESEARRASHIEAEAVRPWRSALNWALSELMLSESESRAADPMYQRAYTNALTLLAESAK